jgi:hypothetical protein
MQAVPSKYGVELSQSGTEGLLVNGFGAKTFVALAFVYLFVSAGTKAWILSS